MSKVPAPSAPIEIYAIGLGSNRRHIRHGDPRRILLAALSELEGDGIEPIDASAIIASEPVGPSRRRYANAVALVATCLSPPEMLQHLQSIEARFGIRRGQRWSARTLDLDLLLWSGGSWADSRVTLPHPLLPERAFVLEPLKSVAPEWRHPINGRTVRQLSAILRRPKPVDPERSGL